MSAADANPHPRAALVIGNADYVTLNPVSSAANDEHDMCQALTELGYSASCFADVKDTREFKAHVQDFAAALKPKSEVVFYFAGHALQVRGENYLAPVGAAPRSATDVPREAVSLAYILAQLLQGKHYLSVVILDTCRGSAWPAAPHGMTAGLAPITAIPKGTVVMYGTAPPDYAAQIGDRNGTFTRHLLANITAPGLTADELFKKISEGVQSESETGDAPASVQSPALYTNFTGEFCFGGCIDKVARAELERIEKENEEQLDQVRKQKAALEARKRDAQSKLIDAAISATCDTSVLGDTGRCFAASRESALKAIATAFVQRGFIQRGFTNARLDARADSSGNIGSDASVGKVDSWWVSRVGGPHIDDHLQETVLEAERSSDDPANRNVSQVLTIFARLRDVASINRRIVTFTATRRTVLHDEYHTWGTIGFVPVATSKQYNDVVKNDVDLTDPSFYQDLFATMERDLRAEHAASGATTPDVAGAAGAPGAENAAPANAASGDSPFDHERRFDAPADLLERTLIEALVARGYIVESLDPELGTISLLRRTQGPGDKHNAVESVLMASVTTSETGVGSQLQLSADDLQVLHRDPAAHPGFRGMTGSYDMQPQYGYETVKLHDGAVTDDGFYRELFTAIDASLHGSLTPSKHSQRVIDHQEQTLRAVADALTQHGYYVSTSEDRLGLLVVFKRTAAP
ncbi:MAG TPA: caspase family protein, partial [Steroidobacteraceae bacterium]|nr:caspase family protein [Steroidobacteraceae bacterium]